MWQLWILLAASLIVLKLYNKLRTGWCYSRNIMTGKVVVITGANSGIGFETAYNLARRGAKVIIGCRDAARAVQAAEDIISRTGNKNVHYKHLDLCSLKSVRNFADELKKSEFKVDVLINNAGMSGLQHKKTEDGIVYDMQANHFGPLLLTVLLVPLLKKSEQGRIIIVSSVLHKYGNINFETINNVKHGLLAPLKVYTATKLCNVLFSNELARRLKGTRITVNSLHPGHIRTSIYKHVGGAVEVIMNFILSNFFKNTLEGAQTSIFLAVSDDVQDISGEYFDECKIGSMSAKGMDKELAAKLWDYSEELVKLRPEEKL